MERVAVLAELPHRPEHRDPPLDSDLGAEALQRCGHGRRIGVVALVDQQDLAAIDVNLVPLAAPLESAEVRQRKPGDRDVLPERFDRRKDR